MLQMSSEINLGGKQGSYFNYVCMFCKEELHGRIPKLKETITLILQSCQPKSTHSLCKKQYMSFAGTCCFP